MDPATFECLPVAALLTRAGRVVAANPAYEAMMGLAAAAVVGRAVQELVVERIDPPDADLVARAATSRGEGRGLDGDLWCRVIDARGRRRAVHALWRPLPSDPATNLVFLLDDGGATEAKDAAETFARASGALYRACHEREVLEHAADALAAQGFVVTFLLIEPGDEYLRYGPTRSPPEVARRSRFEEAKVPRTVLAQINPRFHEGRAVFLQNLQDTVNQTYEADVARQIEEAKPGRFAMQAPLFVAGEAYGAIVLTSDFLSPALAGAAEMFAALVARAIENTRTQASLLQSERLAAIGEAAAMMAHEVRNPVATLLNAATLLRKREGDTEELLSMIEHEAQTLERIVSDLLALGRPLVASVVAEDLGAAVEGALAVARMRRPHVQVVLHAAAPVGPRSTRRSCRSPCSTCCATRRRRPRSGRRSTCSSSESARSPRCGSRTAVRGFRRRCRGGCSSPSSRRDPPAPASASPPSAGSSRRVVAASRWVRARPAAAA